MSLDIRQRHPATQQVLAYFGFDHLPEGRLRDTSEMVADVALALVASLPDGSELTSGLRKLLEAKDCMVRAALPADQIRANLESLQAHVEALATQ